MLKPSYSFMGQGGGGASQQQRGVDVPVGGGAPTMVPSANPLAPAGMTPGRFSLPNLDLVPEHLRGLKDAIAPQYLKKATIEGDLFHPMNLGRTWGEIEDGAKQEELAQKTHQFVQETATLDDAQFLEAKRQFLTELGYEAHLAKPGLEQPSDMARGLSGLLALVAPDQAFDVLGAPYAHKLSERERAQALAVQEHEAAQKGKAQKLESMLDLMRIQSGRDEAQLRANSASEVAAVRAEALAAIKAVEHILKQQGLDMQALGLQIKVRELEEVKIPNAQSRRNLDSARVAELNRKIQRYGKLDAKTDAEIAKITSAKGLDNARASLIGKQVAWFDREMQSKLATDLARREVLRDTMKFKWASLAQDKQMEAMGIYAKTLNDILDSYTSQNTALNGVLDDLMAAVSDDRYMNQGRLSPEGQRYAQEYNRLRGFLYGDPETGRGGLRDEITGARSELQDLINKAKGMSASGQRFTVGKDGVVRPAESQEGGGQTFSRGSDGVVRPTSRGGQERGGYTRGGRGARGANIAMGENLAKGAGWVGSEWKALKELWGAESGWNHKAQNPKSTAYGIAQFLDSTWGRYGYTKTDDPQTQIKAGLDYIKKRYGTPAKALKFFREKGWY